MMKKIMIGLIAGMILTLSVSTYAEEIESYIGKVIEGQFPVIVDGKKVDKPGLVIEGTTYLPVRATADLFGYDIAFVDSQVILNKKTVSIQEVEDTVIELESRENKLLSPLGVEVNLDRIKMDGIENQLRILKNREWVLSASEVESAKEELPQLREEISFWENVKEQKLAAE